jgi:PKD repeat protein
MSGSVRPIAIVVLALLTITPAAPAVAEAPADARVIVVLEQDAGDPATAAVEIARAHGGTVGFVYRHALRGFSMELPEPALAGLARHPRVAWVEPDVVLSIAQTESQVIPTGIDRIDADVNPPTVDLGPYGNPELAILDTGIMAGHSDLHVVAYTDCTSAIFYPTFGGCSADGNPWDEDGNGHGTHVSGIAAARDNDHGVIGTAPDARLWSIKVLSDDGTGYLGGILAGIDLVTSQAHVIKVANMSLGFEGSAASLDTAITNSVNAGVVYVVAAGNSAKDASTFSPANHPDVIAVSALADFDGKPGGLGAHTCREDVDDTLADFSNFGSTVDIAAPGVCILSTWNDGGYFTASGTSMASPYVAGAMLRYIAESGPFTQNRSGAEAARAGFFATYTAPADGPVGFTGGSGEPLLYMGGDQDPPPPSENQQPAASFTADCTDLTCAFTATSTDPDGDDLTHAWDFGDGNTGGGATVTHTYDAAGEYTVTLTSSDGELAGTATDTVTVTELPPPPENEPPAAVASATPTSGDAPLEVHFSSEGSSDPNGSIASYSWAFGDGGTSTAANPTHTYQAAGTYTATLTVTDDDGATGTDTVTITVETPPLPDPTLHVGGLAGSTAKSRSQWRATVTITAHDQTGAPVAGVTVTGTWSGGYSGSASCTTGTTGACPVTSAWLANRTSSVTYTVGSLSKDGYDYDASANVATSITVSKP